MAMLNRYINRCMSLLGQIDYVDRIDTNVCTNRWCNIAKAVNGQFAIERVHVSRSRFYIDLFLNIWFILENEVDNRF